MGSNDDYLILQWDASVSLLSDSIDLDVKLCEQEEESREEVWSGWMLFLILNPSSILSQDDSEENFLLVTLKTVSKDKTFLSHD